MLNETRDEQPDESVEKCSAIEQDSESQSININKSSVQNKLNLKDVQETKEVTFLRHTVMERGVLFSELLEKCLKFLPGHFDIKTENIFQRCFSHAKIARAPSGYNRKSLEKDKRRMLHLNFIEFIVFLCMLAY